MPPSVTIAARNGTVNVLGVVSGLAVQRRAAVDPGWKRARPSRLQDPRPSCKSWDQEVRALSTTAPGQSPARTVVSLATPLKKQIYKNRYYYLLLIPAIAYFILFHYKPMYGVLIAFKDYRMLDGILGSPWAGFHYFDRLFSSPLFYRVFRNTVIISVLRIVFAFPGADTARPAPERDIPRTLQEDRADHLVPSPFHIVGRDRCMLREILSPSYARGEHPCSACSGSSRSSSWPPPEYFRAILVGSGIWQEIGWGSIVYLAAISGIDTQQYEAAYVDGANRLQQAAYITIPGIAPVIIILFLLSLSNIMNAGFEQIFNLYNPRVYEVADIIDTYVYRVGVLSAEFSFGAAVGCSRT